MFKQLKLNKENTSSNLVNNLPLTSSENFSCFLDLQNFAKTQLIAESLKTFSKNIQLNSPAISSTIRGFGTDVIPNTYPGQWHLDGQFGVNVKDVWRDYTGKGILVGVVDSGIDYEHSEFASRINTSLDYSPYGNSNTGMVNKAYTAWNPNNDVDENERHGTEVAGLIAANNDGQGTTGIAFESSLVSYRLLSADSDNSYKTAEQIFDEVLGRQSSVHVSNNSWGYINTYEDGRNSSDTNSPHWKIEYAAT